MNVTTLVKVGTSIRTKNNYMAVSVAMDALLTGVFRDGYAWVSGTTDDGLRLTRIKEEAVPSKRLKMNHPGYLQVNRDIAAPQVDIAVASRANHQVSAEVLRTADDEIYGVQLEPCNLRDYHKFPVRKPRAMKRRRKDAEKPRVNGHAEPQSVKELWEAFQARAEKEDVRLKDFSSVGAHDPADLRLVKSETKWVSL